MIQYHITTHEFKGSIKDKLLDIKLPEGEVPIWVDTIIRDVVTKTELCDWGFYPTVKTSESWQREWLDNEHTEFVCVIDGKLKRYQVITRMYYMTPKTAGVSVPEVPGSVASTKYRQQMCQSLKYPVEHHSGGMQEIKDIIQYLNAIVDSKDHSEVLRLVEAAKEKIISVTG